MCRFWAEATIQKDIKEAIQENLTEEFRNSGPQEMNEQSVKKNNLKEKGN
ncbi:hypothetical protein [Peribacillus sp. B2I2]